MLVSDLIIDTFAVESVALRAAARDGDGATTLHADAATVFAHDAALRARTVAATAIGALAEGDAARQALDRIDRILPSQPIDTITPRRRIAQAVIDRRRYPFS